MYDRRGNEGRFFLDSFAWRTTITSWFGNSGRWGAPPSLSPLSVNPEADEAADPRRRPAPAVARPYICVGAAAAASESVEEASEGRRGATAGGRRAAGTASAPVGDRAPLGTAARALGSGGRAGFEAATASSGTAEASTAHTVESQPIQWDNWGRPSGRNRVSPPAACRTSNTHCDGHTVATLPAGGPVVPDAAANAHTVPIGADRPARHDGGTNGGPPSPGPASRYARTVLPCSSMVMALGAACGLSDGSDRNRRVSTITASLGPHTPATHTHTYATAT